MLKRTLLGLLLVSLTSVLAAAQANQFLQAPQYSTGANSTPQAFAIADFNNDGIPDVAVADSGTNSVSIFLQNTSNGVGNGTFTQVNCGTTLNCPVGVNPQGIAAADFNKDNITDLAVTNFTSGTITILSGNGSGGFSVQTSLTTGSNPRGIAVADFNQDGYPDLVVTNSGSGNIGLFINNGSGGFSAQATYNAGDSPWAVAVGYFNGNSGSAPPDLVVANYNNNNQLGIYMGTGSPTCQANGTNCLQGPYGAFTGTQNLGSPVSVAVGDFNGDGKQDVAAAVQGNGVSDTVAVLISEGNGAFETAVPYTTASFPTSVAVSDLDGDGNLDLIVAAADANVATVFWGNGTGGFAGQMNCGTGDIPSAVAAANLTNATNAPNDLIVTNSQGNSFSVIMNNGNQTFQSRLDYAAGPDPVSVVAANFDGDKFLDLALADSSANQVVILPGNGDGTFQPPNSPPSLQLPSGSDPVFIVTADFNQDGIPDLAVVNQGTDTVSVFLGQLGGTYQFQAASYPEGNQNTTQATSEPTSVAVADFNGDGYPDMAITNFHDNTVSILINNGASAPGTFASVVNYGSSVGVGNGPISVAAAKLNGDQAFDLVVINETDNSATILRGTGQGTFTEGPVIANIGGNPQFVVTGDFNGDGNLDLAVADLTSEQVSILLGTGSWQGNGFDAPKFYSVGAYPSAIAVQDYHGDGKLDLAVTSTPINGSPGNEVSLLRGNGDGTFQAPAFFGAGYFSYSLVAGDFNADGAQDLAVANGKSNTASILLNTQGTAISFAASSNPNPPTYGQTVTLTATVAPSVPNGLAAPTGNVTFENGSTVIGSPTLMGGSASVSTTALPAGTNSLTAVYSGDTNYQSHTVYLSETVQVATSSTALTSSLPQSAPNQMVTFTATVNSPQLTGTVTFLNGSTSLGSGTLNALGQAALSISNLPMGTSTITAVYSGNSNVTGSSSSVQQVVGKATPLVAVTSNPTSSNLSQPVVLTATVSGAGGTPTGTVTFFSGTTQLGSPATLNGSGVATYSTTSLTAGTDTITASYSGDNDFLAGTSLPMLIVVTAPNFTLTANPSTLGSIAPGATATSVVTISTIGGLAPSGVSLTCKVSPSATPAATCSLGSISSVSASVGTATLTFTTAGPTSALAIPSDGQRPSILFAVGIVIPAMLLGGVGLSKPGRKRLMSFCLFLALAGCMSHMACGGSSGSTTPPPSGNSGTPAGSYQITVSGTASGVTNPSPATLSATVQ